MTTQSLEVHLPRPHPSQRRVLREARRFNVVVCGRRWGKTTLGEDRLIGPALEGAPVAWFSPTYRMLVEVWRDLRQRLSLVAVRVSVQEHRIELLTGGVVELWSLDRPDVARGRKYRRVVIDEAAMVRELEEAWQAVIRPTLTDYRGDAWFLSTPKGLNYFWQLAQRGQDPADPDWVSWRLPTAANPYIDPGEIEAATRDLPERVFAQEYLAEFLELEGAVFRRVQEAATGSPEDPQPGHTYVFGVDWGKHQDFTVISVLDVTGGRRRQVYQDRFNQIDYAVQAGRLEALAARYRPAVIVAERNAMGDPIIEQLQRRGLPVEPFDTTAATKAVAIEALALALEQGAITILDDPVLVGELMAYEAERLPSGRLRYGAPEGRHDDCVMALALANVVFAPGAERAIVVYDEHVTIGPDL